MRATVNTHVDRYRQIEIDAVGDYPHCLLTAADDHAVAAGSHLLPLDVVAADPYPADLPTLVSSGHIAANQMALEPFLHRTGAAGDPRTWLGSLIGVDVAATPGHIRLTFPGDDPRPARLVAVLTADPELSSAWPLGPRNVKPIMSYIEQSLRQLATACPHLAGGLGALLAEIVVAGKRATGACSSSAAVGAVFLSPRAAWPPSKYVEILRPPGVVPRRVRQRYVRPGGRLRRTRLPRRQRNPQGAARVRQVLSRRLCRLCSAASLPPTPHRRSETAG